ncbi:MAG TPA: PIN domain-containing protein [Nitrospirota bacterium]|nr:PIN domain-containing protein [Nitrospirota bacterium]
MDKILIDTSAWIQFFRKKEPWYSAISMLMDDKRICCSGIILAELIQGAKSEKELEVLRDFRHVFEFLDESTDLWQAAGELSNTLQRKGKSVGLSDCYLAASAKAHKVKILTLDKHFDVIKGAAGIGLYEVR